MNMIYKIYCKKEYMHIQVIAFKKCMKGNPTRYRRYVKIPNISSEEKIKKYLYNAINNHTHEK